MKIVSSLQDIEENTALVIGNFDGLHLGHQYFFTEVNKLKKDLKLVVITFVTNPVTLIDENFKLLTSYNERRDLIKKYCSFLIELPFDLSFKNQNPDSFLEDYIFKYKRPFFFLGHDFSFAAGKSGNLQTILKYSSKYDLPVKVIDPFYIKGVRVSSSLIRFYLQLGKIDLANNLLGYNYTLTGLVVKGHERGRTLGFPTANLKLNDNEKIIPSIGVYLTKTNDFYSITNVGRVPTFKDDDNIIIENHLLDFNDDLYGKTISVSFIKKLRDEIKFTDKESLIRQLEKDKSMAYAEFGITRS